MRATTSISHRRCSAASKSRTQRAALPTRATTTTTTTATAKPIEPATTTEDATSASPTPPPFASRLAALALAAALAVGPVSPLFLAAAPAHARLEGVNKPELLPKGPVTPVLDVAGFLTDGERTRLRAQAESLERDTGVKLRVLAQNYPETPGLAIKDYWGVDDDTVVFVADPNTGNILNFNVGAGIDLRVPRTFWSRLAGKYGTKAYWTKNGEAVSIVNAVGAIDECLREPVGRLQCAKVGGPYVE